MDQGVQYVTSVLSFVVVPLDFHAMLYSAEIATMSS